MTRLVLLAAILHAALAMPGGAQGYRLRLDTRMQGVSWRGVEFDSIPRTQAVPQTGGGFLTPGGHAATCEVEWCHFFRAGSAVRGLPVVTQADVTVWGFGITGLRVRANARYATDLGSSARWPGSEPALQLVEGYAEYARRQLTVQLGRQFLAGRLGGYGLDGGRIAWTAASSGIDAAVYGGWGLARGVALPATSPALNPLDDFQPRDRQMVGGAELGWTAGVADARAEYRREVDPAVDYFVSERVAASIAVRPMRRVSITAGGIYDLSFGQLGSADVAATWITPRATFTVGGRRYLPFFDLWTIWGAFSPVPFHAWHAAASVSPMRGLVLRARGERYVFDDTETSTPLVDVEDRGWRASVGASWEPSTRWSVTAGHDAEFGPGSASRGFDATIHWMPIDQLTLGAHAATLRRPLEFRFSDATLAVYGASAEWQPGDRWRVGLSATRVTEQRDRPDAGAIDWDQLRVAARVTLFHGTDADRAPLPRAVRTGMRP